MIFFTYINHGENFAIYQRDRRFTPDDENLAVNLVYYYVYRGNTIEISRRSASYNIGEDEYWQDVLNSYQKIMDHVHKTIDNKCLPSIDGAMIEPYGADIGAGEKVQFVLKNADGTIIDNSLFNWSVHKHEAAAPEFSQIYGPGYEIGTIDDSGQFTGRLIGSCLVSAKLPDGTLLDRVSVKVGCPDDNPGDIQEIERRYMKAISSGPVLEALEQPFVTTQFPFLKLIPGIINNVFSPVIKKFDDYTCGAYQGEVLRFLHEIQLDPEICGLLNGLKFGPVQASFAAHHAVVVYPDDSDWKTAGSVFDPWPNQKPEVFSIEDWKRRFFQVSGSTIEKFRERYPTSQDPEDWNWGFLHGVADRVKDLYEVAGSIKCPVNIMFIDDQGRKSGVDIHDNYHFEIPDTYFMRMEDDKGNYEWYFRLNRDISTYQLHIEGTDTGEFNLVTYGPKSRLTHLYAHQPIAVGKTARTEISGSNPGPVLILPDGSEVLPETIALSELFRGTFNPAILFLLLN